MKSEKFLAWCRNAAKQTQNPVYAWLAIQTIYSDRLVSKQVDQDETDFVIPAWCALYIGSVSCQLMALAHGIDFREEYKGSIDGFGLDVDPPRVTYKKGADLVAEALGLRNSPWHLNAFRAFEKDQREVQAQAGWQRQESTGAKYDEKIAAVVAEGPAREQSVIRKRIKPGVKFFPALASDNDN